MGFPDLQRAAGRFAAARIAILLLCALPAWHAAGMELATDGHPYPTCAAVWSVGNAPVGVSTVATAAGTSAWPGDLRLVSPDSGKTVVPVEIMFGVQVRPVFRLPTGQPQRGLGGSPGDDVPLEHVAEAAFGVVAAPPLCAS